MEQRHSTEIISHCFPLIDQLQISKYLHWLRFSRFCVWQNEIFVHVVDSFDEGTFTCANDITDYLFLPTGLVQKKMKPKCDMKVKKKKQQKWQLLPGLLMNRRNFLSQGHGPVGRCEITIFFCLALGLCLCSILILCSPASLSWYPDCLSWARTVSDEDPMPQIHPSVGWRTVSIKAFKLQYYIRFLV